MSDEQNNDSTPPPSDSTPPQQQAASGRTYSEQEVTELLQKREGDTWAKARDAFRKDDSRQKNGKQTETKQSRDKGDTDPATSALRRIEQREALADFFAENQIPKDKRELAKQLIADANPDDPAAWVTSRLAPLLGSAPQPPTPDNNSSTKAADVNAPRTPDPGAPQSLPVWERPSDPFKWTAEDIARMQAQMGVRKANALIRQKAEAWARNITLELPRRR
jgi:hypothetical protein